MTPQQMRAQVERFKRTVSAEEWDQRRSWAKVELLKALKTTGLRFKWRWVGETRWREGNPSFWANIVALDELAGACEIVCDQEDVLKLWPAP